MIRFLKRIPFTFGMSVGLIAVGLGAGSHFELLDRTVRRFYGSSLQTVLDGELIRLFSSLFLTAGGWRFFASVLMLSASVGWAEWTRGSWRTIVVFFGTHLATMALICFAFILPLASLEMPFAPLLVDARDVGPSAGYYGCLGFALFGASPKIKWGLSAAVVAVLVGRMVISSYSLFDHPHFVIGDVAHLLAFPIGVGAATILRRPRNGSVR